MEDFLYSADVAVFRWVNEGWSCPFLDKFFSYITDYHHFILLILVFLTSLLVWGGRKGRWMVVALVITVTLTDQVSAHVFKGIFDRIRPCNALTGVLTPDEKPNSYSFPSSHATNMGGSMTLLALAYPPWAWLCGLFGFLVGLSRVYLGVHYPSDVMGGWLLGMAIGWGLWKIFGPLTHSKPERAVPTVETVPQKAKTRKRRRHGRR